MYDVRISPDSMDRLRRQVMRTARSVIRSCEWGRVGICVGKEYNLALRGLEGLVSSNTQLEFLQGGQGARLTALRDWLRPGDGAISSTN